MSVSVEKKNPVYVRESERETHTERGRKLMDIDLGFVLRFARCYPPAAAAVCVHSSVSVHEGSRCAC